MRLSKSSTVEQDINSDSYLLAQDVSPRRAEKLKLALEDYHQAEVRIVDSADSLAIRNEEVGAQLFDAILLDAPCSGFGTTRRRPEIKMRRPEGADGDTLKMQAALLRAAAQKLKPGGALGLCCL